VSDKIESEDQASWFFRRGDEGEVGVVLNKTETTC